MGTKIAGQALVSPALCLDGSSNLTLNTVLQATAIEEDEIVDVQGEFSVPAAPILIPEGPWKEVEGSVCAPKGFKAQGAALSSFLKVGDAQLPAYTGLHHRSAGCL